MTVLEIKNEMLRQMRMDIWVDSNDDDDIVTNYTLTSKATAINSQG